MSAEPFGFSPVGEPAAHSDSLSRPHLPAVAAVSNGAKWSVRTLVRGGPKDSLLYDLIWYAPPTYGSAAFYASGNPFGEVRVWACSNVLALIGDAAIHANAYLTIPISEDQHKLVLCQIGPPLARDVTAAAVPDSTGN